MNKTTCEIALRTAIILGSLAAVAFGAGYAFGAEITGPTEANAGAFVELTATAPEGVPFEWRIIPEPDHAFQTGNTFVICSSSETSYTVILQLISTGLDDLVLHSLTFGEGVDPPPDPGPGPKPVPPDDEDEDDANPTPPTPSAITMVVLIEEVGTSTAAQRAILLSLSAHLDSAQFPYRLLDQHLQEGATNETPAWAVPILEAVDSSGDRMPLIVFMAGDVVDDIIPLPTSVTNATEIVDGRIK